MAVETACEQCPGPGCCEGEGLGGAELLSSSLCLPALGSPGCV